jgi:uncharacterized RDD family membrane protein YckC
MGVPTCKNHGNRASTAVCGQCKRPICDECTVVRGRRILCLEDARVDNAIEEEDRIEHLAVADPALVLHAGFASRLFAALIDLVLLVIAAVLLAAVFWLLTGFPPVAIRMYHARPYQFISYWSIFFLITVAYSVVFTAAEGQTLGKQAMRLAVVEEDGTTPSIQAALVRYAGSLVSMLCLGIGFFAVLRDPQKRAWHDHWSGTYVVSLDEATERL